MKKVFSFVSVILITFCFVACDGQDGLSQLDLNLIYSCGNPEAAKEDIKALIEKGANPTAQESDGSTALHIAASIYANEEIVKLLIDKGADPNCKDNINQTPLHVAAAYGDRCLSVAKVLVEAGSDVNARDNKGRTPLACTQGEKMTAFFKDCGGVE